MAGLGIGCFNCGCRLVKLSGGGMNCLLLLDEQWSDCGRILHLNNEGSEIRGRSLM